MGPPKHADSAAPISRVQPSTPPASGRRPRSLVQQLGDALRDLYPAELLEVRRLIDRMRATRGAASDPDLLALIVAELLRVVTNYKNAPGVPVSYLRATFRDVPRPTLDQALRDAEERQLLRLLPASLPGAFVDSASGIQSSRGLLYFVAPVS